MKSSILRGSILVAVFALTSCNWWRETRISSQKIQVDFVDFHDSIQHLDPLDVNTKFPAWKRSLSPFFRYFCAGVIGIGEPDSTRTEAYFTDFLNAPVVGNAKRHILKVYTAPVLQQIKDQIYSGFQHFHYYFPKARIPKVYFYNSGYNTSLMLGETFVGASLEKFLGDTARVYAELDIPSYFYPNMTPEHVPLEILGAWFYTVCPTPSDGTLLDRMLWEGKRIYFLKTCFPKLDESMICGYSQKQWALLTEQEMALWAKLVEDGLLYKKDGFLINQLCEPAPFTALISQSTPGRAGNWIAYRIVRKYIQETHVSLKELMGNTDSQSILQQSQYKP